jgi:hypothetical protein
MQDQFKMDRSRFMDQSRSIDTMYNSSGISAIANSRSKIALN